MNQDTNRAILKILFGGMSVFMIYLVIDTSLKSNMFQLPAEVVHEPWFQTTLVDFYFNTVILAAWVIYKEANRLKAALWVIAFVCLGSIATCFYVLRQLMILKHDEPFDNVLLRKV